MEHLMATSTLTQEQSDTSEVEDYRTSLTSTARNNYECAKQNVPVSLIKNIDQVLRYLHYYIAAFFSIKINK